MANIPIRDIPGAVVASPDPSNLIPMDNGSIMQKTTIENAVNTTLPLSSQAEAEAGGDNVKRMSPLRTKQAIDAQTPLIVNTAITALNLGTMSQEESSDYTPTSGLAAVALSNDYNDLDNLPTLGTAAATNASDYATAAQGTLASTAVQPGNAALVPSGGTIGQVLVKNSGTNYDTGWVSSAAATAVSYAPQTLTDAQAGQARANIDAGLLSGFRNKIINGDFTFWQRGTSFTLSGLSTQFLADRWKGAAGTGGTANVSQNPVFDDSGDYCSLWWQQTVAASTEPYLQQNIEGVRTLAGRKVTISFEHYQVGISVTPRIVQHFGTGGSPSADVGFYGTPINLAVGGKKSQTIDIPSIVGKTLGTNDNDYLRIDLVLPTGQTFEVHFRKVSLVEGDATAETDPFSPRHIQQELALCQRYYQNLSGLMAVVPGVETANTNKNTLLVPMRATPTVTQTVASGTGATIAAVSYYAIRQNGVHSLISPVNPLTLDAEL